MKKCIAFRPLGVLQRAWIPCGRNALKHSPFCKRHADAMHGAVLGLWVKGFFEPVEQCERRSQAAASKNGTSKEEKEKTPCPAGHAGQDALHKQTGPASELPV